jgi:hypothetical protein
VGWRPGQRAAELELEKAYEDIPNHLAAPLRAWLDPFTRVGQILFRLGMHLRVPMADSRMGGPSVDRARSQLLDHFRQNPTAVLDSIEWVLAEYGSEIVDQAEALEETLAIANSAYRVRADGGGLEMRTIPEVRDVVQEAVNEAAGSPGEHLATAWHEAYGRTPDPVKAYSEAIKAVEAAAAPVVSPKNTRATLGTITKNIRDAKGKWEFVLLRTDGDSVEDVERLMSLLWKGQTSRHGGVNPTVPETLEAARAAVHVAATLVHFFVSGSFATASTP